MVLIRALISVALVAVISLPTFAQKIEKPISRDAMYSVVINHEEQYSIWLKGKEIPRGWKAVGYTGSKEGSLRYIEEIWTDMRPLSNRRATALKIYQQNLRSK